MKKLWKLTKVLRKKKKQNIPGVQHQENVQRNATNTVVITNQGKTQLLADYLLREYINQHQLLMIILLTR